MDGDTIGPKTSGTRPENLDLNFVKDFRELSVLLAYSHIGGCHGLQDCRFISLGILAYYRFSSVT